MRCSVSFRSVHHRSVLSFNAAAPAPFWRSSSSRRACGLNPGSSSASATVPLPTLGGTQPCPRSQSRMRSRCLGVVIAPSVNSASSRCSSIRASSPIPRMGGTIQPSVSLSRCARPAYRSRAAPVFPGPLASRAGAMCVSMRNPAFEIPKKPPAPSPSSRSRARSGAAIEKFRWGTGMSPEVAAALITAALGRNYL
jgi:hypothetical protein